MLAAYWPGTGNDILNCFSSRIRRCIAKSVSAKRAPCVLSTRPAAATPMTAAWHKRHAPSAVRASTNDAMRYAARAGGDGTATVEHQGLPPALVELALQPPLQGLQGHRVRDLLVWPTQWVGGSSSSGSSGWRVKCGPAFRSEGNRVTFALHRAIAHVARQRLAESVSPGRCCAAQARSRPLSKIIRLYTYYMYIYVYISPFHFHKDWSTSCTSLWSP